MKKLIYLALFISLLNGKSEIIYTIKYLPNTTFNVTTSISSENFIDIVDGNKSAIESLKNKGISFPAIIKQIQESSKIIKNKDLDKNGNLSMETKHISNENYILRDNKKIKIKNFTDKLTGSIFYQTKLKNGDIKLNKIKSNKLSLEEKKLIFNIYSNIPNSESFSNKKFKIGDIYEEKTPLRVPINNINMNLIQNSQYKLKEIKDNLAIFDIRSSYTLNINMQKNKNLDINFDGFGHGEIIYDIKNMFNKKHSFLMNFDIDIKMYGLSMKMKTISNTNTLKELNLN